MQAGLAPRLPVRLAARHAVLVGVLAVLGISRISKGTPPVPEQAIAEAKLTTEALKNGKH